MSFWIVTDIGSDLSQEYVDRQEKLAVLPMPYHFGEESLEYKLGDEKNIKAFYQDLRAGKTIKTAQVTVDSFMKCFGDLAEKGENILFIALSGNLSGTIQSAQLAKALVLEKHPNARIAIVDSLSASSGEALLVDYAIKMRAEGKTLEETAQWLLDNRQRLNAFLTVDDLNFLFRGGRLTRSSALLGAVLRIKPILLINYDGKLVPFEKIAGRRRALKTLADLYSKRATPLKGQTVFISHADCREEAEELGGLLQEAAGNTLHLEYFDIGAIIGAHGGPGTIIVFFMAAGR